MHKHAKLLIFCILCFFYQGQAQNHHQHNHNQRDLTDYVNHIASQTNEEYYSDHDHELWHYYLNRPHPDVSTIASFFDVAAEEFGVPADLLKAIGQVENNWTQIGPSIDQGWGIMHLVKNKNVNTLGEAAELTGVSEQMLKDDPQQNIRGAAALLAKYAGNNIVGNSNIALWFEACKTFSGLHQERFQILQAQTYFNKLKSGNISRTVWNEVIEIQANPELVAPILERNQNGNMQRASASTDYGPAISNITPCNFGTGRNSSINTWVNHWIGVGTYAGAISWFHTCRPDAPSSAHFVIRSSDGEVSQVVRVANTAYHAGASGANNNGPSIGIEHEATASNPDLWNSAAMLQASTDMACYFAGIYNIPPTRSLPGIREHNEMPGTNTSCAGSIPWTTWMNMFTTCVGVAPSALDCTTAVAIECGVTYNGTSSTATSAVERYGCNDWTEAGPERIHKVTSPGTGTLTATLTNYTGDLDVYILGSCDPNDCLGTVSSDSAVFGNAVAGQVYYIVVDADDGSGSAYDLLVDCPVGGTPVGLDCSNAVSLTCGVTYSGPSSTAPSAVESYACNTWTETGPERVHIVDIPEGGTLTATLSNYTGDLDVYILSSCDPDDCVGTVSSDSAVLDNAIPGQTYYIVVDADDGSGSAYDLVVDFDCPITVVELVCDNAIPLTCGVSHSEPASTALSNVNLYACNSWAEPGPERVHSVAAPASGIISATISNFTGDLDVFILSACDTLACVAVGDLTATLTTAVPGETYYIIVDGYDGSGSAYDIVVDCPELGFTCTNAIPLTCGVVHSEPASTESSNVESYNCKSWTEPGPERVHSVVASANGVITATISNFTGDLDVFLLSSCDTTACVAAGDFAATLLTATPGQTYYIVVDGSEGSAYDIVVDCSLPVLDCSGAVALECGVPYSGAASTAASNVNLYACNDWGEPGPERVHTVTVLADGTLTATISNFTGDLDLFILSNCDPMTCIAVGASTATFATALAGETYYIVVDGYDGSGSAYDLIVTCPEVIGCVDHLDVNGTYSTNEVFQAEYSITSDATFTTGAVINMHADSILLEEGFSIEVGAEVYIHMGDCQ